APDLAQGGQIAVACLYLLEQAGVFDCNDGLIGKGRDEGNLYVGEGSHLESVDEYDTQQGITFEHRDRKGRSDRVYISPPTVGNFRIGLNIQDVHRSPLEGCTSPGALTSRRDRVPLYELSKFGGCVVGRGEPKNFTVEPMDKRSVGVAKLRRRLDK